MKRKSRVMVIAGGLVAELATKYTVYDREIHVKPMNAEPFYAKRTHKKKKGRG